jgi:hypothetical protein
MMMYRYRQNKNVGIRMQEELSPPTTSGSSNPMIVVYSSSTDLFCNLFLPRRVLRQGSYT